MEFVRVCKTYLSTFAFSPDSMNNLNVENRISLVDGWENIGVGPTPPPPPCKNRIICLPDLNGIEIQVERCNPSYFQKADLSSVSQSHIILNPSFQFTPSLKYIDMIVRHFQIKQVNYYLTISSFNSPKATSHESWNCKNINIELYSNVGICIQPLPYMS